MNTLKNALAAMAIVAAPMAVSFHAAQAAAPGAAIVHINWHGHQKCKAMGNSGWTATARGIMGDGGGGRRSGGFRAFQIRTCFQTRSACNHFINRIHHEISQIEQLHYIGCNSRSD